MQLFLSPPKLHTQPLDVGVFALVKRTWAHILKKWKLKSRLRMCSQAFSASSGSSPSLVQSGFRASGNFPFSREVVLTKFGVFAPRQSSREEVCTVTCDNCGHNISANLIIRNSLLHCSPCGNPYIPAVTLASE